MERPQVAVLLAVAAGILSGFTFYTVHLFSTVQSGNVIQAGYQLAADQGVKWDHAVLAILAFGLGSGFTAILQNLLAKQSRDYSSVVLLFEATVLIALGFSFFSDRWSMLTYAYIVSFLAGMQGNAFHRIDGLLYGNVAVTMVVQLAFNHLFQALFDNRRAHLLQSGLFFLVLLGFSGGGFIGAWGTRKFDQQVLWIAAAILGGLGVWSLFRQRRGELVDIPFETPGQS